MSSRSLHVKRLPPRLYEVVGFFVLAVGIGTIRIISFYRLWVPSEIGLADIFYISPWTLTSGLLIYGAMVLSTRSVSKWMRIAILSVMLGFTAYFGGLLFYKMWAIRTAKNNLYLKEMKQRDGHAQPQATGNLLCICLAGQKTGIQDAKGNWVTMMYDDAGRQTVLKNQLGHATTTAYDAAGRSTTILDAKSQLTTTTFDKVGRLVTLQYSNSTIVTMQYDGIGQRTTMIDSGGTTTYAWDDRGSMTRKSLPGAYVLQMGYDAVGNRTTLVDPDGGVFTSTFDALNRVASLKDPDGNLTTMAYDADSRLTTQTDAAGVTNLLQYDSSSKLTTSMRVRVVDHPEGALLSFGGTMNLDAWDPLAPAAAIEDWDALCDSA